jgi:hypothetical protein
MGLPVYHGGQVILLHSLVSKPSHKFAQLSCFAVCRLAPTKELLGTSTLYIPANSAVVAMQLSTGHKAIAPERALGCSSASSP